MDIKKLVAEMTLEEKAGLCSGQGYWHTKAVERLGLGAIMVSDGPHGLRKQADLGTNADINKSIKAVGFPAGCATACSFDEGLLEEMGALLGEECQAEQVAVLLGPGANIKRSPLCGRNFEYYSEDPYVAGRMATGFIKGVQGKGVGTSLKHFFANNQESRRMTVSANIDTRTMREIYLAAFEAPVREAKPWTVMCAYNRINGTYAAGNQWALTEVLRDEWGFDGFVVSDWNAVDDRVADLSAGLDLQMPGNNGVDDRKIIRAVESGALDMAVLDRAVERILGVIKRYEDSKNPQPCDWQAHHAAARRIAGECMVLLKNEDSLLPLDKGEEVAFIGGFAGAPRFQGGGSSFINCFTTTSALDAVAGMQNVRYAKGFAPEDENPDPALLAEAVQAAKAARVAVVFAGLPGSYESEGYDRTHLNLPAAQNALIAAVAAAQPNTVVVLHNGSPVAMPWLGEVKAVVEAYLGGQAVGGAVADVLFGEVNPSGKLAETFPLRLQDTPCYRNFPGQGDDVDYREGVFVGYRHYDSLGLEVLFPFGHGLSYTSFEYSGLKLSAQSIHDSQTLTVEVTVRNTGARAGKEAVQLYVGREGGQVIRPPKWLAAFGKVALAAGQGETLRFELDKRAFAYWDTTLHDWQVEPGRYTVMAAASSRDIRLTAEVEVQPTRRVPRLYTMNTTVGDLLADPLAAEGLSEVLALYEDHGDPDSEDELGEGTKAMKESMYRNMPLRNIVVSAENGEEADAVIHAYLAKTNQKTNV